QIPAMESTSREILQKLRKRAIDSRLLEDTRAVLQEADMVKFAKFRPSNEQARRALEKARDFLKRAEEIDASRVKSLQQSHRQEMEQQRKQFQQKQTKSEAHS